MPRIQYLTSLPHEKSAEVCELVQEHHFGLYETIGKRPTQEDAVFACWYARDHFKSLTPQDIGRRLWTSYHLVNILGRNEMLGGTTASTTVYDGMGTLITATLADSLSFAVIYDRQDNIAGVVRLNSMIHHPNAEQERIQRAGGLIFANRINGQLAISRAIGDFDFNAAVVCADATIDINDLHEIYAQVGTTCAQVGKVQMITTCDGFTEPLTHQTKQAHEQWLLNCLQETSLNKNEEQLAQFLANKALEWGSRDNISIAVQTLSLYLPFLVGVYDGHGGKDASHFTAEHIGSIFDYQCSLSQEAYAQQSLSAEKNFLTYYRDNKDLEWYEPLAELAKNKRESEITKAGVPVPLQKLMEQIVADQNKEQNKDSALMLAAAQNLYQVLDALCRYYVDLSVSKEEFHDCITYILKSDPTSNFDPSRYLFIPIELKAARESAVIMKRAKPWEQIWISLNDAFILLFDDIS